MWHTQAIVTTAYVYFSKVSNVMYDAVHVWPGQIENFESTSTCTLQQDIFLLLFIFWIIEFKKRDREKRE